MFNLTFTVALLYAIPLVLLAAGALALYVYLARNVLNPAGKGAERKTAGKLKGYARTRRFRVLSGVVLPVQGGGEVLVESMLIGYFGVLLVHTLGARGEYYGRVDGEQWTLVREEQKTQFPNPLRQQDDAIASLRALLSRNKVFKVPMERVVYISSRAKKTSIFITHDGQILLGGKLGAYLDRSKFDNDAGVDVDRVAQIVEENRLR